MKIRSGDVYAGIPILQIRRLLKETSESLGWTATFVQTKLEISAGSAARVIRQLAVDGFIEPAPKPYCDWRNTQTGNALAHASVTALLHRETAQRKLDEFLKRIRYVNSSECEFLYTGDKVVLLGSTLGEKQRVSDVDVSFQLVRKPVTDYIQVGRLRVEEARKTGRNFDSYFKELAWPEVEVRLFLRNRSRALSFVEWDEDWMSTQPLSVIYERQPAPKVKPS